MNQIPKKTLYLLVVLIAVALLTLFVLWKGMTEPTTKPADLGGAGRQLELNFSLLQSKRVKKLELFKKLPKMEKELSRDNPFSPYSTSTPTE